MFQKGNAMFKMKNKVHEIGDILSISKGIIRHRMIYIGNGDVVHATKKKGVIQERLCDACGDKKITNDGRWSNLSDVEIIQLAKKEIGKSYDLFSLNCEHFVCRASGLEEKSPQLFIATAAVVGFFVFRIFGSKSA